MRRRALLALGGVCLPAWMLSGAGAVMAAELPVRGDLIGAIRQVETRDADTLLDVARRHDLGFTELRAANPDADPWLPGDGTPLTLPTAHLLPDAGRRGIVINLPEQRLYYFRFAPAAIVTFPIGTPRADFPIPLGETTVVAKRIDPVWHPPASIRAERPDLPAAVPPGEANPLGRYALNLGWPSYLIHGTNKPDGIGRRVTHGCIRLYPEDIETLFRAVAVGVKVTVVDQRVKVGWSDGALFVEVHAPTDQLDRIERFGRAEPSPESSENDVVEFVGAKAGVAAARVDWAAVRRAARSMQGIPVRVTP